MDSAGSTDPVLLPLVVHVGFAGSRRLLDPAPTEPRVAAQFEQDLEAWLAKRLVTLRAELGLGGPDYFLCGISQVAVGADMAFSRALSSLKIPQRVFLSQPRDVYLAARGESEPDFDDAQRQQAAQLLDDPNVIQERVVSEAADRKQRFLDVNLEITSWSDVLVCLVRAGSESAAKPGGTHDLVRRAKARKRPVLEISVHADPEGHPRFEEAWHCRADFRLPSLPAGVEQAPGPAGAVPVTALDYGTALKDFNSQQAQRYRSQFEGAALGILTTHLAATFLAVTALGFKAWGSLVLAALLALELAALGWGLRVHHLLHRSHAAKTWALARLLAEIARSVIALARVHAHLDHLFRLSLHDRPLHPLLCTLDTLHLRDSRPQRGAGWEGRRSAYLAERLEDPNPKKGQIAYYALHGANAGRRVRGAQRTFLACTWLAIGATLAKCLLELGACGSVCYAPELLLNVLGILGVMLPMVSVAALSLSAALDLEARAHTYGEMRGFLLDQAEHLRNAGTEGEFHQLALETEGHLVGETAAWFARRSFLGVA